MESRNYKHGHKAFVFTLTTSVILLVLFALVYVYSQVHSPTPQTYLLSEQLNSITQEVSKAQQYSNALNYTSNATAYSISEKFTSNKKVLLDNNKNYFQKVTQELANQTTTNITFSSIDYNDFNLFSSNFNYHWNYSAKNLTITGDYSLLELDFKNPQVLSDNCSQTGGQTELKINNLIDKKPQGECLIQLNISNEQLKIKYDDGKAVLNFSNISSTTFNTTAETMQSSKLQEGNTALNFSTTSTTNPGWTEPTYPENTAATKHYATITVDSINYNVIIINLNSTNTYDAVYLDDDSNFTDGNTIELKTNNSKVFLNNSVFLLNIQSDGNSIQFTKLNAVHIKKLSYEIDAPI